MMEILENLPVHPRGAPRAPISGDLLSHVLSQIRLTGDQVYSRTMAHGDALDMQPGEAHVVAVMAGTMQLLDPDQPSLEIEKGALLLLPRGPGDLRLVASTPQATAVVCRFWFDPESLRGMVFALPHCLHLSPADAAGWIDGISGFLMVEAMDVQPGSALMISRLIDLVVIRALRTWVHLGHASGWLGGLPDARIARALKAIHEQPMQKWTIATLADIAGMSRSSFCDRFAALVGRSPLRYQNEWRLGLARDMIVRREARVGEVGLRIGYASEAAFSRAYKEHFGRSPRADYAPADVVA